MPHRRLGLKPLHILLVEDESLMIAAFRMMLTAGGHRVEVAETGEKAMAAYEAGGHDLVITDYSLPGADGLALARKFKKHSPKLPVMLVTGMLETLQKEGRDLSHIDCLLGKPFSRQQLHDALVEVVRPANAADPQPPQR